MEELLAELEPEFGPGRLFRPYRDVRFNKDKSPAYRDQHRGRRAVWLCDLSLEGLGVGAWACT